MRKQNTAELSLLVLSTNQKKTYKKIEMRGVVEIISK